MDDAYSKPIVLGTKRLTLADIGLIHAIRLLLQVQAWEDSLAESAAAGFRFNQSRAIRWIFRRASRSGRILGRLRLRIPELVLSESRG